MEPSSESPADIESLQREKPYVTWKTLFSYFSPSERLLLYILTIALGVSSFVLLAEVNMALTHEIPADGGTLVEGGIGTARFINPLHALTAVDQDLTTLVYSGLVRAGDQGRYLPDLAERYEISDDGTTYTFYLRPGLTFHDGTPLTAADVLFTISLAQNPDIKSPRRADWEGVQARALDDHTVVFQLPHAYAPFLDNATIGILPKDHWDDVSADEFLFTPLNTHPIGSGPYRVIDRVEDATGVVKVYTLASFSNFALGAPHVRRIIYRIYTSEEHLMNAFQSGEIESFVSQSPKNLPRNILESKDLRRAVLARIFAVFFNQNHAPLLAQTDVRKALAASLDPLAVIDSVLKGYGVPSGPIPPGLIDIQASTTERVADARSILEKSGWRQSASSTAWTKGKDILALTLATADTPDLIATAEYVATAWNALGASTTIEVHPLTEFNQAILRPRAYDAVLFGEVIGRPLDLFAFWHSSQRNDPGLNLALYTSQTADKALAAARIESDPIKRTEHLAAFLKTIDEDVPAVFLYAPEIAYIIPSRLQGVDLGTLTTAADRFNHVNRWYRDTERVWNFFK